jgi:hypothetical protein
MRVLISIETVYIQEALASAISTISFDYIQGCIHTDYDLAPILGLTPASSEGPVRSFAYWNRRLMMLCLISLLVIAPIGTSTPKIDLHAWSSWYLVVLLKIVCFKHTTPANTSISSGSPASPSVSPPVRLRRISNLSLHEKMLKVMQRCVYLLRTSAWQPKAPI